MNWSQKIQSFEEEHLEILNAGGLYGKCTTREIPSVNDYRNPLVASAMKTLGHVNMFNRGVGQVQTDLKENGNLPAEFNVNLITAFKIEVKVSRSYTNDNGGKTGGKFGGDVALIEITDIQNGIIDLIRADVSISIDQMAVKLAVKKRTLEREIAKMKQKGHISRTGFPRSGKWEIIIPYNCVIEIVLQNYFVTFGQMVLLVVFINAILILDSNQMKKARNTPSVRHN